MNKKELKIKLKEQFYPIFKERGFTRADASGQGVAFYRKTTLGYDIILMASRNYGYVFPTGCSLLKTSTLLARINQKLLGEEYGNVKEGNIVLNYSYRNFIHQDDSDVVDIESDADIAEFKTKVLHFLDTVGWDFLDSYGTLKEMEDLINRDLVAPFFYIADTGVRATHGLILAKMVGNPSYLNLIEEYRVLLKEWPDQIRAELEQCVAYLETEEFKREFLEPAGPNIK